jgi:bacteriocin-like protein
MSTEKDLDISDSASTSGEEPEKDAESTNVTPSSEELTDEQLAQISGGVGAEPPPMDVHPQST